MEHAARRPLLAVATLTTAAALTLAPTTIAPPELHTPSAAATYLSTQTFRLTDAWSALASDSVQSVVELVRIAAGADGNYPLPSPTIPLAPIATQIVLNQLIYLGQLLTGHGGEIPGEIAKHLTIVGQILHDLPGEVSPIIIEQLQTPFIAAKFAIDSISASSNPLVGLFEAPAIFFDVALNSQTGLLGKFGPIGLPLIVRNAVATAIDPPLPAWLAHILQPAKPATASTVALKVAAPHRAGINRFKPRPSDAAGAPGSTNHPSTGVGHGKQH